MTSEADRWTKPRRIAVVVDNPSWVLPFAEELVEALNADGDRATLFRDYDQIPAGTAAFFLGCIRIAPKQILDRNRFNLVVHASPLPKGRGFSPLTWLILEGRNEIPVCLLHAAGDVDSGAIIYREELRFDGHELIEEMRLALGRSSIGLCRRFLSEAAPPAGQEQVGEPSYYQRRKPDDSALDPHKTIAEQFDLLRTVDNRKYPAFFDHRGHRYEIRITKQEK